MTEEHVGEEEEEEEEDEAGRRAALLPFLEKIHSSTTRRLP